jgi:MFS family permease
VIEGADPRGHRRRWLNRTVLGVGFASFLSDVAHETATSVLPILMASFGAPAAGLGVVEGIADAASGAAKLWGGWFSDRLRRRKPLAVLGYVLTACFTASLGGATRAWHAVAARSLAWAGRGVRTPARNALLAGDVASEDYGKAFGFERALDTLGAVVAPFSAAALVVILPVRSILMLTIVPGLLAACAMAILVKERARETIASRPFLGSITALPAPFRRFLIAVGLFGLGDFAHSLLILRASETLKPALGEAGTAAAAMTLYGIHNVAGAALAFVFGAAGDRFGRLRTLALSYILGPLMVAALIFLAPSADATPATASSGVAILAGGFTLVAVFLLGGALLAAEDALESAAAAELLPESLRGTGFGALAAVNSAGDLISSLAVGILWQAAGPTMAFVVVMVPMLGGILMLITTRSRGSEGLSKSE